MSDKNTCVIGVGSNIQPEENIREALRILEEEQTLLSVSAMVQTEPIGVKKQPSFINGAVKISTSMNQEELSTYLKNIEDRLKRDRSQPRFGSRTIDLDVVVWNGKVVDRDYYSREFLKNAVDEVL
ncbi:2-amino-4-hydroxy-6-hydroxymethyldihydropteridine diphosphokinase [Prolixibacter sp. SD074]|jgi:2-amino-4-hydroxy-6-hydroxymethyldihydropteridine diphosphokinase|uniref:2-amino-4-hydroxy-6- hydroxymethyldihydropteridine diphosphokinase n=1 Tax=Prolixibacter sp. SD074 TaxID=2652391 RepID=UPI00127F8F9C|nr:2-amino-4-hydroxy-6-hydroxymethyldihydropteridine diphosphokinase [Prolixibacter sp. SD074]GET30428.1 2-amino-4-hydroxy-6-hydroxymethyldihydropteridine diphosphokinase [Prolixibacter sp. SD074]